MGFKRGHFSCILADPQPTTNEPCNLNRKTGNRRLVNMGFKRGHFSCILVDECGNAVEPEARSLALSFPTPFLL